jgi:hypothetical protein
MAGWTTRPSASRALMTQVTKEKNKQGGLSKEKRGKEREKQKANTT